MFEFTDTVPAAEGRTYLDHDHANEIIDALVDNPNQWARIPITYLYPDLDGADEKKLKMKALSLAGRIQSPRQNMAPFSDYNTEAKSRGTDVYIRVVMSARQMRELGL